MKLQRAIELCQEPLNRNKSALVKVCRFALIHVLDDYHTSVKTLKSAQAELGQKETTIDELRKLAKEQAETIKKLETETVSV